MSGTVTKPVHWSLPVLFVVWALLAGMAGAGLLYLLHSPLAAPAADRPTMLVSVDMVKLLNAMVRDRSRQAVAGQDKEYWERQARHDADYLQRTLNNMAVEHGWVVVRSEAVVAGAIDITDRLQNQL